MAGIGSKKEQAFEPSNWWRQLALGDESTGSSGSDIESGSRNAEAPLPNLSSPSTTPSPSSTALGGASSMPTNSAARHQQRDLPITPDEASSSVLRADVLGYEHPQSERATTLTSITPSPGSTTAYEDRVVGEKVQPSVPPYDRAGEFFFLGHPNWTKVGTSPYPEIYEYECPPYFLVWGNH
jgi:hypothetical protein